MATERTERHKVPYKPREIFLSFHSRTQRYAIGVAHRRAGKTVACVNDMIRRACTSPLPNYRASYIAPFKGQAKDTAWEYLKRYSRELFGPYKPNENELYVRFFNEARIKILGADNEDSLRGGYLDDVVLDEYADMSPTVFPSIIRPMLADRKGTATFIGTPKGRNAFFHLLQKAQADEGWFWFLLKASETGILPEDELADARREMTQDQYAQEFECSFEAAILGAYYGKEMTAAQEEGRIRPALARLPGPMHCAWDFGNGLNMAVWAFQVGERGPLIHDFIQMSGCYFEDYLKEVTARGYDGFDYVPHDAKVPSFETGRTRIETMLSPPFKRKPMLVADHHVDDGINAAKLMLPRAVFNGETCAPGLEALRQYVQEWDDKARVFKRAPKHDWASHAADALRYLAMGWREYIQPKPEEKLPLFIPNEEMTIGDWIKFSHRDEKRERA